MNWDKTDPILVKAFQVFLEESTNALDSLELLFKRFENNSLSKEDALVISQKCHTIKGGAGFFDLTEIMKISGKLERAFGSSDSIDKPSSTLLDDFIALKSSIEELVKETPRE